MEGEALKFLVTDKLPDGFIEGIEQLGFKADHFQTLSNEALAEIIDQYTGIVVNTSLILDKTAIDKASILKYILRPGSGLDNIDIEYAESKGIRIFSSPEANADAVAEHAMGLLLALMNFIPRASEQVKGHQWIRQPNNGTLLKGKTVGIIGYGHTGPALAEKLSGFGVKILVYDKYKHGFGNKLVEESPMEQIFETADVLSLHIPLTQETENLVNDDFIARFSKSFYLINTSRGKNVKLQSVINGLNAGKLLGAGIDVLDNEDINAYSEQEAELFDELVNAGNIIITPHIAGWTTESREGIFMLVLEKFKKYFIKL